MKGGFSWHNVARVRGITTGCITKVEVEVNNRQVKAIFRRIRTFERWFL